MRPSFAAARQRYMEDLVEHQWYDIHTLQKAHRDAMATPGYLFELLRDGHVTAVEMHSHTPRSDGWIKPEDIAGWTRVRYGQGYFRHRHFAVPLVVMVTDHDYLYASHDLRAHRDDDGPTLLPAAEVSTTHGHVLYYGDDPEIVRSLDLLRPRLSVQPDGLDFLDMVHVHGRGVAVPAHPYREGNVLRTLPGGDIAGRLSAVEVLNGKTLSAQNRAALDYARLHGVRGTGGSDAHQISHLYSYLTLFDGPIHAIGDLVVALREGDYFAVHGEHLRLGGP